MTLRLFLGFFLLIFFVVIIVAFYRKEKDLFAPLVIFSLLSILRYVPGIMFIDEYLGIEMNEQNALLVFAYEILFVICVVFGYLLTKRHDFISSPKRIVVKYSPSISTNILAFVLYAIGFAFGVILINRLGGLSTIIYGAKISTGGNGNSYIRAFTFLMVVSICLLVQNNLSKLTKVGKVFFWVGIVLLFLVYSFFFFIQTSRSPVLEALMILVMVYNYQFKKIRLRDFLKPKSLILIIICGAFIVLMPYIRGSKGTDNGITMSNIFTYLGSNVTSIFKEFCYSTRDGFIYTNYNADNFWYGSNIVNLICSPLPSSLFSWKPTVDDGMYLANATLGYFVKPPSSDLPWYNSYPLSSPGGLFINFGFLGIIFGGLFLGFLYKKTYSILKRSNYDVFFVIVYQLIVYQFEFSSLSIVQTLTPLVVTYLALKVFSGMTIRRNFKHETVFSKSSEITRATD